jgi:hypothetical protein
VKEALRVEGGKILTPSGQQYRVLVLDSTARTMTLPVLRKLGELVKAGMYVVGAKPERSPGLIDNPTEFTTLANQIWSSPTVSTQSIEATLAKVGVEKDVDITGASAPILFVHRQTSNADLYWLDNRSDNTNQATISFRVAGKVPELWNPETGKLEKVSYQIKDGRTIVPLKFDSWGAYFIVFQNKTTVASYTKPTATETQAVQIEEAWNVSFQEGRGAPASATLPTLRSLSENADPGIKYFSGTASYTNTFQLANLNKNATYVLDLGDVKNIAEVIVNGKLVGTVWKKPYRIDISDALKAGSNTVQVNVTNTWVNRLIGDAQPGVTNKVTFTTLPFYKADSALLPSGLLGPVRVMTVATATATAKR